MLVKAHRLKNNHCSRPRLFVKQQNSVRQCHLCIEVQAVAHGFGGAGCPIPPRRVHPFQAPQNHPLQDQRDRAGHLCIQGPLHVCAVSPLGHSHLPACHISLTAACGPSLLKPHSFSLNNAFAVCREEVGMPPTRIELICSVVQGWNQ